jgi:hypothetical protein
MLRYFRLRQETVELRSAGQPGAAVPTWFVVSGTFPYAEVK